MTKRDIRRAARMLQSWSDAIDLSGPAVNHSIATLESATAERDEMRRLSKMLYAMAREPRQLKLDSRDLSWKPKGEAA